MPRDSKSHCEEILKAPPPCGDFKGQRSYALCSAWKSYHEEKLDKLPLKQAWAQIKAKCQKNEA